MLYCFTPGNIWCDCICKIHHATSINVLCEHGRLPHVQSQIACNVFGLIYIVTLCVLIPISSPYSDTLLCMHITCTLLIDHRCEKAGSGSVIVLDGNMKNNPSVCLGTHAGYAEYDGLPGAIQTGCPNTPAHKSRFAVYIIQLLHRVVMRMWAAHVHL